MTSADLYRPQFSNSTLTDAVNLLAIEPLGHGKTRGATEHFTYWDTAIMSMQVLDKLDIKKFFALGTSQGGWIVTRMALLAPDNVEGIIVLGTSMEGETQNSRDLGCWDIQEHTDGVIQMWTTKHPTPDFELPAQFVVTLIQSGFGNAIHDTTRRFWTKEFPRLYVGDDGRQRARMSVINLRERDGLYGRLFDVTCPVLWLHGTEDAVYTIKHAEAEIKLFINAKAADLVVVPGGAHFLSASHPNIVDKAVEEFVSKWVGKGNTKAAFL